MIRLALVSFAACAHAMPPSSMTAFVDATVVTGGTATPHRTVVVDGDRIVAVGGPVPDGARVVSASGKFLVPGFADMHVHLPESQEDIDRVLDLSLACGVTTIRGMQGKPSHLVARARHRIAPDLVLAGPPVTEALTPEQARSLVRDQKAAGYDLIKILGGIDRPAYDAIVAEAAAQHIPVVGHVPTEIGLAAALAAKQRTIEHVQGYARDDDGQLADQARQTRAARIWNCPTLDFYAVALGPHDHLADRDGIADYATADDRATWDKALADRPTPADGAERLAKVMHVVAALRDAGAPLLVGSDTPDTYALPGFGYLEELRALARAGVTPSEILRAATENAAASLDRPHDGKIAPGARADLVLLDRDPLATVDNLAHPAGVMVRGHWLSRADLDALLAAHRTHSTR
ncbi:MAG TPA: amidohydrolase family protein [Kofleriaceae bacterium]|nr:amidohydrolase family protein [Kofleriaceae bacterium]